ncbi:MAG: hypothetical protein KDD82_04135 [Planctomycetes bacterium]|nr:hypothetical protein [Planctomycetota bacterium]
MRLRLPAWLGWPPAAPASPSYSLDWAIHGWRLLRMRRRGRCVEALLSRELRVFRRRARVTQVADCRPPFAPPRASAS